MTSPDETTARRGFDLIPSALIVLAVIAVAAIGGTATDTDSSWYRNLELPQWQPDSWVFGPVWTTLYVLIAVSMIIRWHRAADPLRRRIFAFWAANLVLNLAWTVIFFQGETPIAAGIEILVLEATTVALIILTWPVSRAAALILVPYALWVGFATVLTWSIAFLN